MTQQLFNLTNAEIVERLIVISIEQGDAIENFETAKYNKLYDRNQRLLDELSKRPGDGRHDLFKLYDHPNMQVRLNAAHWTYALDTPTARVALAAIRDSRIFPYAADAGLTLSLVDKGIGKLS